MSKNDKKRKLLIGVISGAILLVIIIFLLWFFNRKFDITLDYNDGTKTKIVQIKYNKAINKKDIENTDGLNATWYEVVEKKENEDKTDAPKKSNKVKMADVKVDLPKKEEEPNFDDDTDL